MKIKCYLDKKILHVVFPMSDGKTWSERHSQFLKDQLAPEQMYTNPGLCHDVLRVSKRYEGENQFVGFNFPASYIKQKDLYLYPYKKYIRYVIAYMEGDKNTIEHEKRHAQYHMDRSYRKSVKRSWKKVQTNPNLYQSILQQLTQYGYQPKVFIDEFQAYYPHLIE